MYIYLKSRNHTSDQIYYILLALDSPVLVSCNHLRTWFVALSEIIAGKLNSRTRVKIYLRLDRRHTWRVENLHLTLMPHSIVFLDMWVQWRSKLIETPTYLTSNFLRGSLARSTVRWALLLKRFIENHNVSNWLYVVRLFIVLKALCTHFSVSGCCFSTKTD